jgi:hypothetical protein
VGRDSLADGGDEIADPELVHLRAHGLDDARTAVSQRARGLQTLLNLANRRHDTLLTHGVEHLSDLIWSFLRLRCEAHPGLRDLHPLGTHAHKRVVGSDQYVVGADRGEGNLAHVEGPVAQMLPDLFHGAINELAGEVERIGTVSIASASRSAESQEWLKLKPVGEVALSDRSARGLRSRLVRMSTLNERRQPGLEQQDRKHEPGSILARIAAISSGELLDRRPVEKITVRRVSRAEALGPRSVELCIEPRFERRAEEPDLSLINRLSWEEPQSGLLENTLRDATMDFHRRRHPRSPLD